MENLTNNGAKEPSLATDSNAPADPSKNACETDSTAITLITSIEPSMVCKTFSVEGDELHKGVIANITSGTAVTRRVTTAADMMAVLTQATEGHTGAICGGRWDNSILDEEFKVISEKALANLLNSKVGEVQGGVIEHSTGKVSARIKRGIKNSHWLLLDADNPPGIPAEWAEKSISERLEMWEPFIPGITQCERIELRASSARVSNTGEFGTASHAWIRISHPEKLSVLKAHVRVQMVLNKVSFPFEKRSRKDRSVVVGVEDRSVFDLAVFDTGRLVFCAKPRLESTAVEAGYKVADAAITLINEGSGALDVSWLELPKDSDVAKLNKRTGSLVQFSLTKSGNVKTVEEGKLRLTTEIESRGVVKTLREWIEGKGEDFRLRCESPFRESRSEAAFIGINTAGMPYVYDIGNSTTYYLSETEKVQLTFSQNVEAGYRADFRPSKRYHEVITDYVYLEEDDRYYRPYDGAILKATAVNHEFAGVYYTVNKKGEKVPTSATTIFHARDDRRRAKSMGWHPVDQLFFSSGNAQLVNTYEGLAVKPVEGDVSQWLSLVRYVYGEYADLFLDHLAYTLQRPEKKINWQILTLGKPRTGKSMSMRPIKRIWGSACQVVDPDMMGLGWGDLYAQKKVIVVEEVWRAGEKKFFNSIKPGLVNDDPELLNMKKGGMVRQLNLRAYYMFTNHADALSFNEDEDKLLVIEAPSVPWGTQEQFKELADWVDTNEGAGAVLNYLLKRDVSQFSYGKLPERTGAMLRMVELSQPDYHRAVVERAEEHRGVFARDFFTFSDVRDDMRRAGYSGFGDKGLKEALMDAGYEQLPQPQKKIDGAVYSLGRIWTRADSPLKELSKGELFTFVLHFMYIGTNDFEGGKGYVPFEGSFEKMQERANKWGDSNSSSELLAAYEYVMRGG